MFGKAHAFNQDLKSWDVSSGTNFVSNGKSMGIDSIPFSGWAVFFSWVQNPIHS
jgi:hypothetical protein